MFVLSLWGCSRGSSDSLSLSLSHCHNSTSNGIGWSLESICAGSCLELPRVQALFRITILLSSADVVQLVILQDAKTVTLPQCAFRPIINHSSGLTLRHPASGQWRRDCGISAARPAANNGAAETDPSARPCRPPRAAERVLRMLTSDPRLATGGSGRGRGQGREDSRPDPEERWEMMAVQSPISPNSGTAVKPNT